jgi:hypothetical protein|nr:MAG TPA: hypothetical protein [Caudoviricetes sp.]
MLYEIKNKIYIRVGGKYKEVIFGIDKNGELTMTPNTVAIEVNRFEEIKPYNLAQHKEELLKKLKSKVKNTLESNFYNREENYSKRKF